MFGAAAGLVSGVSVRHHGDARSETVRSAILALAGLSADAYVGVRQVHGVGIAVLEHGRLDGAHDSDGLVTREPGYVLGIRTADCVPIMLADVKHSVIGIVHAGWRGTEGGIVKEAVRAMEKLGAAAEAIQAFIGPHIGACCYTVDEARAARFLRVFDASPTVAYREAGEWHLGLGSANRLHLIEAGIAPHNIEYGVSCTSCQVDRYFSYRKDTKESFGEMLSFISLRGGRVLS